MKVHWKGTYIDVNKYIPNICKKYQKISLRVEHRENKTNQRTRYTK